MDSLLLEASLKPCPEGTRIIIKTPYLEPILQKLVGKAPKGKDTVETEKGVAIYNTSLVELLGSEMDERIYVDLSGGYLEDAGQFNMVPLLLVGTSRPEGATIYLGPSNKLQRKLYWQALQGTMKNLLDNVISAPELKGQMIIREAA